MEISREEMSNRFIALANEFAKTEAKERVGAAIMFAASRYNAYEASVKSENLAKDKPDALDWYSIEYRRMLNANLDELIELRS
jgi:hypothetical protein